MKQKTAFAEAAQDLADQTRGRFDEVDIYDARASVDPDVIVAWIVQESMGRQSFTIVADTLSQRLTEQQCHSLLCAVAIDNDAKIAELVKFSVVEQVARDLMYEANKLLEQYDPTDEEMSRTSYASWVADPVADDRRALAKLAR